MYREIGGLQAKEPGYKKIRVAPSLDCGLTRAEVKEKTPYGTASVKWEKTEDKTIVNVEIPANTTAEIVLPGRDAEHTGSGKYTYIV